VNWIVVPSQYLLLVSQSGLVCYSSDLDWIHFDLVVQDDNA
jgi:hypothetical protein